MINAIEAGKFMAKIWPSLYSFGQFLYKRYGGRSDIAIAAIEKLKDQWENFDVENARIDEELATLRREGK